MADLSESSADMNLTSHTSLPFQSPATIDDARALARERFKSRLVAGEKVGECGCHEDDASSVMEAASIGEPVAQVVGVRFRDSGRTFYFQPAGLDLQIGDWVVVETTRGREAGRVVIAPQQVRYSMLQGDLKPVTRRLEPDDIERMDTLKRDAAKAVKTFGALARTRQIPIKPISAEYSFDGSSLVLNYSLNDRDRPNIRQLTDELATTFGCRVEMRQVGARDEARLLGGLGRCGRTLCCSSWLPVYPEISMNMAKTQDLPLNPSKVSGVCGRLLCCLSYENEQYKRMKAVMPRLGQSIETPAGPGMVISLQILKELVTVRLDSDNSVVVHPASELGLGSKPSVDVAPPLVSEESDASPSLDRMERGVEADKAATNISGDGVGGDRRRRRRGRGRKPMSTTELNGAAPA